MQCRPRTRKYRNGKNATACVPWIFHSILTFMRFPLLTQMVMKTISPYTANFRWYVSGSYMSTLDSPPADLGGLLMHTAIPSRKRKWDNAGVAKWTRLQCSDALSALEYLERRRDANLGRFMSAYVPPPPPKLGIRNSTVVQQGIRFIAENSATHAVEIERD